VDERFVRGVLKRRYANTRTEEGPKDLLVDVCRSVNMTATPVSLEIVIDRRRFGSPVNS